MPSGIAAAVRQQVAGADKDGLVLEESPLSRTGYTNVIEVRGKFQARLQVKGDGQRKRYQHPLPGLFDTAFEAAQYLAILKRDFGPGGVEPPPKQIEQRKPRRKPPAHPETQPVATLPTAVPVRMSPAAAMATPIPFGSAMMNAPLVAATALPLQLRQRCRFCECTICIMYI